MLLRGGRGKTKDFCRISIIFYLIEDYGELLIVYSKFLRNHSFSIIRESE